MPRNTKLILCPVNLRHLKMDYGAYEEAIAMAKRRGAKLLVATVAPEMERNLNIRDSESYWGEQLRKFVKDHPAEGIEMETVVRKGAVHRQIVRLANERNVDVIVMESAADSLRRRKRGRNVRPSPLLSNHVFFYFASGG